MLMDYVSPAKGALWGRTLQPSVWPTFHTPQSASEGSAPGWTVESWRRRESAVPAAKGIATQTPTACTVGTAPKSQTPPVCLRGPRVRFLTIRPSLPRRPRLSGWPDPVSPTPSSSPRISAHQTRPCLTDPAPSTPSAWPRISTHQTRPCLRDGGIVGRWRWPRLPGPPLLLYLWDRACPDDAWPWTSLPIGLQHGCGADGETTTSCCSPRRPTNPRRLSRSGWDATTPAACRSPDAARHRGRGQGIWSQWRRSRCHTSALERTIGTNLFFLMHFS